MSYYHQSLDYFVNKCTTAQVYRLYEYMLEDLTAGSNDPYKAGTDLSSFDHEKWTQKYGNETEVRR